MPWPVPTAKQIAATIAGSLEAGLLRIRPDAPPEKVSLAVRSAQGVFSQLGRAFSLELREVHDHLAWWGRQYFVDTAEDEFVLRHAAIWGVTQRAASRAIGSVLIEGTAGTAVPSGLQLSASIDPARICYDFHWICAMIWHGNRHSHALEFGPA
jgi:hypothetical protein